jgi:5,10-methylenetetrahydromethanopterin reductase
MIVAVRFSVMFTGMYAMADVPEMARRIEQAGFDELHVADDLIFRPAWPMLTVAAMHTSRIRLGPFIVTPQVAHPAYHASNLAALDELSGGRAICGIGRGGFNPLIGVDGPKRAIAMLREAYMMMRRMIDGDRTPFAGDFFTATEGLYFQFDIERRTIPIFIGTWGPKMARMAGTVAPGIKADCVANPDYVRTLRDEMRAGAVAAGRDPDALQLIVGPLCSLSPDRDRAIRHTKELLALLQSALAPMTANEGITSEEIALAETAFHAGDIDAAVGHVSDRSVKAFSLSGAPRDVIPQIEALIDAGVTNIAFGPPLGPDFLGALHLIETEILPAFKAIREA